MLAVQGEAYKKQYGLDSIHLILTNLYGPGDSYNTERSHVVAALVRKWVEADIAKAPSIEVWGTGKPVREFIYVEDCADAIVLAAEKYNDVSFTLEYRHRHRHLDSRAGGNDQCGHRLRGQDRLERRQARRGHDEGARRQPHEASARRLGATDQPQGGPGQDHRLVPGQQGPGGRQMVNRRHWYRHRPAARATRAQRPASRQRAAIARLDRDRSGQETSFLSPHASDCPARAKPRGKRILFINQYYWPDHASTAQHLTDLAESLAGQGYECHVLASQGRYKPGEPRPPAYEIHKGVHIHRVPATSLGRRGTWARMTDYLSFYAVAMVKALLLPRFDAVVTLTTPPMIGLVGTLLKRLKKTRHVYWSMDLHPDASLALGRMSPKSLFARSMYWLSGFVYRHADQVVVLGPYMADRIALKGVAARADHDDSGLEPARRDLPDPARCQPAAQGARARRRFVAMYSGNLGLAHSFDEFIEAARRLRDRPDIVFLYRGRRTTTR